MGFAFLALWALVGYVAAAAVVGAALAAAAARVRWRPRAGVGVLVLFVGFALIDSYWLPLAYALDLACTMDVSPLTGPGGAGAVAIPDLFTPDPWDAVAWVGQVVIATHIASWLRRTPQVA
jgi:hypothetical protein